MKRKSGKTGWKDIVTSLTGMPKTGKNEDDDYT
jgi:hypothetical protein